MMVEEKKVKISFMNFFFFSGNFLQDFSNITITFILLP